MASVNGTVIDTRGFESDVQVYLFGQSGHERTQIACRSIRMALGDPVLEEVAVDWIYVLNKGSDPLVKMECIVDSQVEPIIVHDRTREVFGAFGVIAVPSTVITKNGKVVHVIPSLTPRYDDIAHDAILFAANKISEKQFEFTLHPVSVAPNPDRVRAERIMKLAKQAGDHGMIEMASSQYARAIELDPTYLAPRLAFGKFLYDQSQFKQAQDVFEVLLEQHPQSPDGMLGLAAVLISGSTEQLDRAERLVEQVLGGNPKNARAYFTQGLLYQRRGRLEDAVESFKRSAKIMLDSGEH